MHRRLLATISLTDLPHSYELNEGWGNSGRVKQGDDVFVLVKEYICSAELRQDPMLVLKKEVMDLYPLVPETESPSRDISDKVKQGWIDLGNTFESLHGGNEHVRRAAQYLRDLARNNLPKEVLAPLPFHTSAEMMPAVPAPEYQPHEVVLEFSLQLSRCGQSGAGGGLGTEKHAVLYPFSIEHTVLMLHFLDLLR